MKNSSMKTILDKIVDYRLRRGWTEYMLSVRSALPQSTISCWYCKGTAPTVASLQKICAAFGITMSQLFAEGNEVGSLTDGQMRILNCWDLFSDGQKETFLRLLQEWHP